MGWIKCAIGNLSMKKTFMLYMLMFILLATMLSSISINFVSNVKNQINLLYSSGGNQHTLNNGDDMVTIVSSSVDYTSKDRKIINICIFVETWSIPIFFGLCIVFSALLFYRNKLKIPIELLSGASDKIACNELDFQLFYESKDEMGCLCVSFETMRAALEENNREMWRAMEEHKRLNAAFSHDLRTPLTVLRGYADLLKKYWPKGKISEKKLMSTITTMSDHIARLENYVQMMSETQKPKDIKASAKDVEICSFLDQLQSTAKLLTQNAELKFNFENEISEATICLDSSIALRVYENLIANAVQYAKSTISIRCRYSAGNLIVVVADDGKGFTPEDLKEADKPYYRNQPNSGDYHFGMGLYICRNLCEKHGGGLLLENGADGGARVTAAFDCKA